MSKSEIDIQVWSNVDYEKLVVEMYHKGKFVALLNQDDGLDNLKIEFPGPDRVEDMVLRKIDLSVFEKALELAKREING